MGTRLWPYSRAQRPKQFHAMAGSRTMIQDAVERIAPIAAAEDVFVSTGTPAEELVRQQLPQLPNDHLIVEPALRNTGPAVGLECALLEARYPGCTVASLGSDHYIGRPEEFCRILEAAAEAADREPDYLFTVGIKPTRAETGYGYIRKGKALCVARGEQVFEVNGFTEKPDAERAREYLASGDYLWNSNMFVWKAATVLALFERHHPEIFAILDRIRNAVGSPAEREVIADEYVRLPDISVDHAIIEPADRVATLEADVEWGDIGSWAALTDVLPTDDEGNLFSGQVLSLDSQNTTAYGPSGKLIALIGVQDLVVVDTADALLVCRKDQAQRVREIAERLQSEKAYEQYR